MHSPPYVSRSLSRTATLSTVLTLSCWFASGTQQTQDGTTFGFRVRFLWSPMLLYLLYFILLWIKLTYLICFCYVLAVEQNITVCYGQDCQAGLRGILWIACQCTSVSVISVQPLQGCNFISYSTYQPISVEPRPDTHCHNSRIEYTTRTENFFCQITWMYDEIQQTKRICKTKY